MVNGWMLHFKRKIRQKLFIGWALPGPGGVLKRFRGSPSWMKWKGGEMEEEEGRANPLNYKSQATGLWPPVVICRPKIAEKSIMLAGAQPWTPLGKLTALPMPLAVLVGKGARCPSQKRYRAFGLNRPAHFNCCSCSETSVPM